MHLRPRPSSSRCTARRFVALLAAGAVTAHAAAAGAAWSTSAAGSASARAASVSTVARPTTTAVAKGTTTNAATSSLAITVSWSAPGAHPATGYTVTRISPSGQATDAGSGCLGTVVATSCTENLGANGGGWAYRVTPRLGTWVAAPSPASVAPTDLVLQNGSGGTLGAPNQGDTITIHFSAPVDRSSICGSNTNGFVGVTIENDAAPGTSNDLLTLVPYAAGNGCSNPKLGSIDLGSKNYVSADVVFNSPSSRSQFNVFDNVVTVALGARSSGANPSAIACGATVDTCPVATFVPHDELTAGGVAVTGTVTKQARNF